MNDKSLEQLETELDGLKKERTAIRRQSPIGAAALAVLIGLILLGTGRNYFWGGVITLFGILSLAGAYIQRQKLGLKLSGIEDAIRRTKEKIKAARQ